MEVRQQFLSAADPLAYLDHPTPADNLVQWRRYHTHSADQNPSVCPACKGYGGRNLKIHAYALPLGVEDTPENRHKYRHFRTSCLQCSGWGYTNIAADATCAHEYDRGAKVGNCLTNYKCVKCGHVICVDSSD